MEGGTLQCAASVPQEGYDVTVQTMSVFVYSGSKKLLENLDWSDNERRFGKTKRTWDHILVYKLVKFCV